MDDSTRRQFVRATALTSIGLLAGCSDGGGGGAVGTDEDDGAGDDADDDGTDDDEAETETPESGQEETEADLSFSPRAGDA
ncbi:MULTISPECIES: hypothetical protein [Halomicrobium]|uniref:Copper-binding plastocyanin like protein n=2 Tax=Halomicrobium mukohataei TaxID=57705 RepID=C7P0M6_HALMD|nr:MULTISPECIES: hypothetical protein [Halomicrobium]ACV47008.1 copper-binding plastocyanin like protein [Halomicrobium mukohataei DSM 12286]QCD65501.1 copper-binding protein [Halomicrobium mukohataei]QFR20307.1 copper-binding protein [Halomicrobium sp. ZPS1]